MQSQREKPGFVCSCWRLLRDESPRPRLFVSFLINTVARDGQNRGSYGLYNVIGDVPRANSRSTSRIPRQRRSLPRPQIRATQAPLLHECARSKPARQNHRRQNKSRKGFQELVRQHMLSIAPRDAVEVDCGAFRYSDTAGSTASTRLLGVPDSGRCHHNAGMISSRWWRPRRPR